MNASLGNRKIKNLIAFNGNLLAEVKEKYEGFSNINARGKKMISNIQKSVKWLNAAQILKILIKIKL